MNEATPHNERRWPGVDAALHSTGGAVMLTDAQGFIEWVNPAFLRMSGYSTEQVLGQRPGAILQGAGSDADLVAHMRQALARQQGFEVDILNHHSDGTPFWNHLRVDPIPPSGGRPLRFVGLLSDITVRKQAELVALGQQRVLELIALGAPLPETLEVLVRLLEQLMPGLLCSVLLLDADQTHLRHGAAPSLPGAFNQAIDGVVIGPNVGSCGTAVWRRAAVDAPDITNDVLWFDYREIALAHGLRACQSTPILDALGQVLGTFAVYRRACGSPTPPQAQLIDKATHLAAVAIGQQHKQQALREAASRYAQMFDANPQPMWVFELASLRFLAVNDAAVAHYGHTREEFLQLTLADIRPPEELPKLHAALAAMAQGLGPRTQVRHRTKAGRVIDVEMTSQPIEFEGRVARVALAHDVTERYLAQAQLLESRGALRALLQRLRVAQEEERTRVAREVHDELGQLLTGMKMDLRWLERKLSAPGQAAALNALLDRTVAASELNEQTIATVQKLSAELRPGALDHLGLAAALAERARQFQQRSGVTCTLVVAEPAPELPRALANELFYICQEALTNVTRHAMASQVHIHLVVQHGQASLVVVDDGIGIDPAAITAARSLGLLGMRERALQCGGALRLEAVQPHGTRIVAELPLPLPPPAP